MTTDHNEAMRLADALLMGEAMIPEIDLPEAAALLRKQSERIAELERLSTGLSTVYNEAMDSLRIAVDERDTLRAEVERQTSALKVIYTWAGIPGALKPENVRELSGKALGKATS